MTKPKSNKYSKILFVIILLICFFLFSSAKPLKETIVKIHYLGHASFIMQFDNDISVLMDFGKSNCYGYKSPIYDFNGFQPDIVTYSHEHEDHYRSDISFKKAKILTGTDSMTVRGLEIIPIRTYENFLKKTDNTSYVFVYKGLKILHLGDAQALIKNINKEGIINKIKDLYTDSYDLVLMPIEGRNKMISQSEDFIRILNPKYVVPMHYWSIEYKDRFFEYLEDVNKKDLKKYNIIQYEGASFILSLSNKSLPITVISLNPGNFVPNK